MFKEICIEANSCGYNGWTATETVTFLIAKYGEKYGFTKDMWNQLEIAYLDGRSDFLIETETVQNGHC